MYSLCTFFMCFICVRLFPLCVQIIAVNIWYATHREYLNIYAANCTQH